LHDENAAPFNVSHYARKPPWDEQTFRLTRCVSFRRLTLATRTAKQYLPSNSRPNFDVRPPQLAASFISSQAYCYWQILLQKSFRGGERKFLEPLMRFTRGDARDHIASSKIDHGHP
jgi:hypothetical protein